MSPRLSRISVLEQVPLFEGGDVRRTLGDLVRLGRISRKQLLLHIFCQTWCDQNRRADVEQVFNNKSNHPDREGHEQHHNQKTCEASGKDNIQKSICKCMETEQ